MRIEWESFKISLIEISFKPFDFENLDSQNLEEGFNHSIALYIEDLVRILYKTDYLKILLSDNYFVSLHS